MKNNRRIPLELYVHIPFCVRKCQYCDFLSGPSDEETKDRYIEALLKEIRAAEHTEDYENQIVQNSAYIMYTGLLCDACRMWLWKEKDRSGIGAGS